MTSATLSELVRFISYALEFDWLPMHSPGTVLSSVEHYIIIWQMNTPRITLYKLALLASATIHKACSLHIWCDWLPVHSPGAVLHARSPSHVVNYHHRVALSLSSLRLLRCWWYSI